MSTDRYPFREIEAKWQRVWEERKQFSATEDPSRPKFYCLEMFPYPSGRIHMGHVRVYAIGDLLARFKWMRGFNVLHPMGWDAFGLPAENAAIEHGVHPAIWTYENIDYMREQLRKMGISYDSTATSPRTTSSSVSTGRRGSRTSASRKPRTACRSRARTR